ncbi:hypothetical protein DFP72DRAFT_959503 [Ephemerocybe angulata]|uniref:Fungal-type protein kinase domain-containing protein n=1 Tax=Ephemerocybe angulata TaxID=980116 RepID=A0A8H6MCI2_9AGAR|nr:hypothetical protein DFP72DRAFT_959503 [Tulosesus angulatus]
MSASNTRLNTALPQTSSQGRSEPIARPASIENTTTGMRDSQSQRTTRRAKSKPQPRKRAYGNSGSTNHLQEPRKRPFTRSLAAANRAQQCAPPEPEPVPHIPAPTSFDKPESQSVISESAPQTPMDASPPIEEAQDIKNKLGEQRRAALYDLHKLHTVDSFDLKDLYKDTVSERRIDAFLAKSTLYDLERQVWVDIPKKTEDSANLTSLYLGVIKTIIDELGHSKGTREVVDARDTEFPHLDDRTQSSKPSIAIKATGPSFSLPDGGRVIGFSNVASVFDVKRDVEVCEDDVDQLAVYNRQLFFHQLNRVFSRALLFTETRVRLVHCDRSGGYKTTWLNIHNDPRTFIRLVLGLSSPRESALGLDTSVQWTVRNGVKVAGTIATLDTSGKKVKHQLMMGVPYFVKHSVRGSGTVCWIAKDKAGKRILIKDAWRTDAQVPEYTFLERAKGLAGVAEILAAEDDRAQTKTLRTGTFDFALPDFYNRTMCRVTMECYGSPLHQFTSQRQALAAIRDAIKGHWNLLKAGILHRDVSIDNILLGEPGAPVGRRGALIDLDMATLTGGRPTAPELTEVQAGTYLYQSVSILRNGGDEEDLIRIAHDYLDDLESFFWVLCHLLHGYEGVGQPVPDSRLLSRFENPDAFDAAASKQFYLTLEGPTRRRVPLFWSEASVALGDSFCDYIFERTEAKLQARWRSNNSVRPTLLQGIYHQVHYHYHDIIGLFDAALEKLDRLGEAPRLARPAPLPSSPPANFFPGTPSNGAHKRKSDEDHDATTAKRLHRSPSSTS